MAYEVSAGGGALFESGNRTSSSRVVRQFQGEPAQSGCECRSAVGRTDLRRNDGGIFRRRRGCWSRQTALFHPQKRITTSPMGNLHQGTGEGQLGPGPAVLFAI